MSDYQQMRERAEAAAMNGWTVRTFDGREWVRAEAHSALDGRYEQLGDDVLALLDQLEHARDVIAGVREAIGYLDHDEHDAALVILDNDVREALARLDARTSQPVEEARELLCMKCGREHPVWFAPNPIWNAAVRRADGTDEWPFLCPTCFANIAAERDVHTGAWVLTTDVTGHEQAASLAYALGEIVTHADEALSEYRNGAPALLDQLEHAREALQRIERFPFDVNRTDEQDRCDMKEIARAALARLDTRTETEQ